MSGREAGGLVRAERHVPVEEGGQVPAAGRRGHLVRVDDGEGDFTAEVNQQAGTDEVADRRCGHPRPQDRERHPRACVSRSAVTPASIPRSAARTASGSAASTTCRDHRPGPTSAAGTSPDPVAHRYPRPALR
ncbi:hypothetical protein ACGFYY_35330 [Streptomyces sp. NPDC048331]|uniref:hypothetical protein n=1 Tax=Streptomyces sp. NPDC048331 TaxID=3365534 RepID=UPI00371664A9